MKAQIRHRRKLPFHLRGRSLRLRARRRSEMGQQVTRISAPKPSSGTAIIGGTTPATIGTRPALTLPSTPATAIEPCKLGDQRLTPAYAAELWRLHPTGGISGPTVSTA